MYTKTPLALKHVHRMEMDMAMEYRSESHSLCTDIDKMWYSHVELTRETMLHKRCLFTPYVRSLWEERWWCVKWRGGIDHTSFSIFPSHLSKIMLFTFTHSPLVPYFRYVRWLDVSLQLSLSLHMSWWHKGYFGLATLWFRGFFEVRFGFQFPLGFLLASLSVACFGPKKGRGGICPCLTLVMWAVGDLLAEIPWCVLVKFSLFASFFSATSSHCLWQLFVWMLPIGWWS